jgi:hypothetical protein
MPNVALGARERLIEDLRRAAASGRLGDVTPELALEFAIGLVLQAMQAAAEGRIAPAQAPRAVAGILRAIGVNPEEAEEIALRPIGAWATNRRRQAINSGFRQKERKSWPSTSSDSPRTAVRAGASRRRMASRRWRATIRPQPR